MAKWGPLQTIPPGLLGMLQLKNLGQAPQTLDDSVIPGIDLTEWYMVQNRETLLGTRAPANNDQANFWAMTTNPLTVPDREFWYVWSATASIGFAVGDYTTSLSCVALVPGAGANAWVLLGQPATTIIDPLATPQAFTAFAGGSVREWFGPGTQFGYGGGRFNIVGAPTLYVTMHITRLPI